MKMQSFVKNRKKFIFIGLVVFSFFLLDTHLVSADCGTCPYTCVLGFGDVWSGSSNNYTSPGGLSSWLCNDSNGSFIVPNACVHSYTPGFCGAPAAVACVGSWSNNATCSVTGACGQTGVRQQTYTITTPASGGGAACPFANGATRWGSTACSTAPCLVVNGACAATHYTCGAGTSINNVNGATTWTWSCQGSGGGSTAACSENKSLGTVNVSSNVPSSWTITGPATISGSGTSQSSPSQPTGAYTITWGTVAGHVTPAPQNLSLSVGGTISFSGTYTAIVLTPTANLSAFPISVPYNTSSTLNWSSTNATSCTAGGAWSGSKPTTSFGVGTAATFASVGNTPMALAFDAGGNLYSANLFGTSIHRITPEGIPSYFASVGSYPYDLAFDTVGNLYTANGFGGTISKITPAGNRTTFATVVGSFLIDLIFDTSGNLFVADLTNNRIYKITPAGSRTTFATVGYRPESLAFDASGNLYVGHNSDTSPISKITPAGVVSTFATLPFNSYPEALAFDVAGNLYTANASSDTVSRITPAGAVSTFATVGDFPVALAFDAAGNLYTANAYDNTVSRITPARVVSTFATTGASPRALAFDVAGNLYTANSNDDTVSKITPAGGFNTGNLTSSQTYTLYCSGGGEDSSIQTVVVNVIVPPTLKMCPNSCVSGGTPYNTLLPSFPADAPVTLYACYGTGNCSLGDVPINGTWTETNAPDNAIGLSTGLGLSVDVTQSNLGNASEQFHLSYPSGVPVPAQVTATAAVSCAALTCNSPSIISQRASYCPSVSNTFDDTCGGMTVACDGTRNCDFNWKEIAP